MKGVDMVTKEDERVAVKELGVPALNEPNGAEHSVHVDDVRVFIEKVAANHGVVLSEARIEDLIYKFLWSAAEGKAFSVNNTDSDTHGIDLRGVKRVIEEITLSEPESEMFSTHNDEVNTHTSFSVFTAASLERQYDNAGVSFPISGDVLTVSKKSPKTSPIPLTT